MDAATIRLTRAGAPVKLGLALLLAIGGMAAEAVAVLAQDEEGQARMREYSGRVREYSARVESLEGVDQDDRTATDRTVVFDADVLFEFDSDEIDDKAEALIRRLAVDLEALGPREVTIAGHTDAVGSASYNQDLSERRAESVRDALAARLDSEFTFDVTGYGQTQPVADNDTEEGQARNRRVEITYSTG